MAFDLDFHLHSYFHIFIIFTGGTRDAIMALIMIFKGSFENNNNKVYVCYVDFKNAFETINWVSLMAILADIGVDWRDRNLIAELYINQKPFVIVAETPSSSM